MNKIGAMIIIANKNHNESEYHDLPLQNFQTGNKIIANGIMDMVELIRLSNTPNDGSAAIIPVTVQ